MSKKSTETHSRMSVPDPGFFYRRSDPDKVHLDLQPFFKVKGNVFQVKKVNSQFEVNVQTMLN